MAKKNILDNVDDIYDKMYNEYSKKSRVDNTINTSFNPKQNNMSRFLTYGSRTYGELGFDPTRDNNAYYNANTNAMQDVARGFEGVLKLGKIGFNDTFAFGVNKDEQSSFAFEKTMNDFGSTRGGAGGFISNTLLSSGYTAGILTAIAAEEIALSGLTALTGGGGAGIQAAETGAVIGRGLNALDNARQIGNTIRNIENASDINQARTLYGGVKKAASYLKPLNPFDNTIDFVKDVVKGSDKIEGYSKTVLGAGALVRDMRKLYMTHSESKLEAEMSEREFFKNEYEKAQSLSPDGTVDDETLKSIENRSKQVYSKVYTGNLGLIYATNAIGFDNMFKTMKGVSRGNSILDNGLFRKTVDKQTGKVTFEALQNPLKGIRKHLIDQKNNLTSWKGLTTTALGNSMEGIQEISQDVISTGTKNYYHKHKVVEQTKGGFLEQTFADILKFGDSEFREALGEGVDSIMNVQGAETFMSGFLMGAFASPVGLATKSANSFLFEGGFQDTFQKVKNTKEFEEIKLRKYKQREAKAKILTEFYNNSKNFVDFVENPILTQQALQEEMLTAARNGDTFTFKNAQEKSFSEGLWSILENGLENDFKTHLKYMSDKFNVEELKQIFSREDITENNAGEFRKKLNERAQKVDEYKKRYDAVNLEFKNPISLNGLTQKDPGYLDKFLEWKAYDSLRKDMVSSLGLIKDHSDRLVELRDEFSNNMNVQNVQQFSQFYDTSSMSAEIKMLEASVQSNKGLKLDADSKKQNDINALRLSSLKDYDKAYKKFQTELSKNNINEDTKKELYDAFKELHTETDWQKGWSQESINNSFNKLLDYTYLTAQIGHLTDHTSALSNFDSRKALALKNKDLMKFYNENKEKYILNALKEYELKKASDDMMNDLYDKGFFFDVNELDDLLNNQEMPEEVFNIKTNSIATLEEKIQAQDIISKHITNLKKLDLIEDNVYDVNKQGKKNTSDNRTLNDIFEQYGIKENQVIDLSTSNGFNFIQDLLESSNLFKADKAIIEKFISLNLKDFKIKFVTNSDRAVEISEDGKTYILDLRFVSSNYKVGEFLGFESLISRVFTQEMISNAMEKLDQNLLEEMMIEIRNSLKEKIPVDFISYFNDPKLFLSEVLNNVQMQQELNDIQLSTAIDEETMWDDFVSSIENLLRDPNEGFNFQGNALRKITGLLNNAFNVQEDSPVEVVENKVVEKPEEIVNTNTEFIPLIVDDNLESLYAEKNSLNIKLEQLKKEFENKKSKSLERQINYTAVKILKIDDKIKALKEKEDLQEETIPSSRIDNDNYTMLVSEYGTDIITKDTPWANIPEELKKELLNYFGLSSTAKRVEIENLMEALQTNVEMQQIVTEYNARIETEELKTRNQQAEEINKTVEEKRKQEFLNKARNKKKNNSLMDNLKNVLGEEDFNLLTENEKKQIEYKIKNSKNSIVPFTFDDVFNIIKNKKARVEKNKLKKELKKKQIVLRNSSSISLGKLSVPFTNMKGQKDSFTIDVNKDLLNYIKSMEKEIFMLPPKDFKNAFNEVLIKYNDEKKYVALKLKSVNTSSDLENLILSLMRNKTLIPEIASKINKKSSSINSKLKLTINETDPLFYNISYVEKKAKSLRKKETNLQQAKNTINDFIQTIGIKDENELVLKGIVALGLERLVLTNDLLKAITTKEVDYRTRSFYTRKKGISKIANSLDGASDNLKEDSDFFETGDEIRLDDLIKAAVLDYRNSTEAILDLARKINVYVLSFQKEKEVDQNDIADENEDLNENILFYNTEEGKVYLDKTFTEALDYFNSEEHAISIGSFKGSFDSLNSRNKELYLIAVEAGLYPESLEVLISELNKSKKELSNLTSVGPVKRLHNKLVKRLEAGEKITLTVDQKKGSAVTATLDNGERVVFYDHKNKIEVDNKGQVFNLSLLDVLTLEDGRVFKNVIEVEKDGVKYGNVAENDYAAVSEQDNTSPEIENLKDYIANLENLIEGITQAEIIDTGSTTRLSPVDEVIKNLNYDLRSDSVKDRILNNLNTEGLSILQLLALAKASQISLLSDKNKKFIEKNILSKLNSLSGAYILLKGEIQFLDFVDKDGTIGLRNYDTDEMFNITLSELINGFEKELNPGDVVGGEDLNVKVPENQIDQVKEIYLKVFSNFEITNLSDEEIKTSLLNHIKEC